MNAKRVTRAGLRLGSMLVVLCSLAGCGSNHETGAYRGDVLTPPMALTTADLAATFQSSQGGVTSLSALQRHKTMLLYFGYTHCPDICPATMSDLASALRTLTAADRSRVQVVFMTSDPRRDSAAVLKAWLANFDSEPRGPFVGLTGPVARIDAVAKSLHIFIAPPVTHKNGTVSVQHGAEVLAFSNGAAHLLWSSGTSARDYVHDLTKFLASGNG